MYTTYILIKILKKKESCYQRCRAAELRFTLPAPLSTPLRCPEPRMLTGMTPGLDQQTPPPLAARWVSAYPVGSPAEGWQEGRRSFCLASSVRSPQTGSFPLGMAVTSLLASSLASPFLCLHSSGIGAVTPPFLGNPRAVHRSLLLLFWAIHTFI